MTSNDLIALHDFDFVSTRITGVTGTGVAKSSTSVTLNDGTQSATIAFFNQRASQFAANASAYTLRRPGVPRCVTSLI